MVISFDKFSVKGINTLKYESNGGDGLVTINIYTVISVWTIYR